LASALLIALPAFADIILPGRCPHMGMCWENKFIKKTLLETGKSGTLYSVEVIAQPKRTNGRGKS
jgi:hypothetical protein